MDEWLNRDRKRVKAAERDRKRALLELLASIFSRHLPANENISQMSADTDSTSGYFNPQLNSDQGYVLVYYYPQ